jgi:hypothetical protein
MAVDLRGHPVFRATGLNGDGHYYPPHAWQVPRGAVREAQTAAQRASADRRWVA